MTVKITLSNCEIRVIMCVSSITDLGGSYKLHSSIVEDVVIVKKQSEKIEIL